jgi:hypothetical protein
MEELKLSYIPAQIQKTIEPFFLDILSHCKEDIISMYVIGSAVTNDFHPKNSDINTLLVVKEIKIPFFDFISTLGKRYGKKRVRAPLVMTKNYICRSLEVFPLEFLEMKLINQLAYGDDVLKDIKIEKADIRLQCERELKGKLENLCLYYIKAMGNKATLMDVFVGSLPDYFPAFRGILFLHNQKIPREKGDVLYALEEHLNIDVSVFKKLLELKSRNVYPPLEVLKEIFKNLYHTLDILARNVDEFEIKHA